MLKHFAKKKFFHLPIFFSAKREKFCCLNQRRILRKFFQTKQPFAKSFSFFVSNEAPMSCFLTLHFNIFFRKWILHLAESLCNKEKQQHAEYLFAVSRKRKLILQQNLKRTLRKSSTQQQDYFTVNAFRTSSNQRQPFLQKQANQTLLLLLTFFEIASNRWIKMQELSPAESAAASRRSRCVDWSICSHLKLIWHKRGGWSHYVVKYIKVRSSHIDRGNGQ